MRHRHSVRHCVTFKFQIRTNLWILNSIVLIVSIELVSLFFIRLNTHFRYDFLNKVVFFTMWRFNLIFTCKVWILNFGTFHFDWFAYFLPSKIFIFCKKYTYYIYKYNNIFHIYIWYQKWLISVKNSTKQVVEDLEGRVARLGGPFIVYTRRNIILLRAASRSSLDLLVRSLGTHRSLHPYS